MQARGIRVVAAAWALAAAACSGAASTTQTGPPPRTAPAQTYVLRLDELPVADFRVFEPAAPVTAATLVNGDVARLQLLSAAHFQEASRARFTRGYGTLSTTNGPIDVISTVERFADATGATRACTDAAQHADTAAGALPLSTGRIGDQSHAVLTTATAPDGVTLAQVTLVWRTVNLVSLLVTTSRLAGSPLQDALDVARPQVLREGGAMST